MGVLSTVRRGRRPHKDCALLSDNGLHKACAKYFILVSVVGHATAHYVNYAKAPARPLTYSRTYLLTLTALFTYFSTYLLNDATPTVLPTWPIGLSQPACLLRLGYNQP